MPWSKLDDEFYDHPKVVEAIDSGARVCYYVVAVRHGAAVRAPGISGTTGSHFEGARTTLRCEPFHSRRQKTTEADN